VRQGLREALVRAAAALFVCVLAAPLGAQGLPARAPTAAGLAPDRLARIDAAFRDAVADGKIAGAVVFVARGGRTVDFEAVGWLDADKRIPMPKDAIFRIASMSKAVTTVAALILVEEGRLTLEAPVSRYVPAFAKTTVLVPAPKDAPPGTPPRIEPSKRPITIRDLMTHTAGISYGSGALEERYKAAGAWWWYLADKDETLESFVDRLATLPFEAQPGERFVYGFSTDVLGRVVEVVSGQRLDALLESRIFRPLRMPDTSFFLPREKRARLATVYGVSESGKLERAPEKGYAGQGDYVDGPRRCFSGGAGLLSTAADYGRFLQMLLNGGALDGVRLLSPKTVALATANNVGALYDDGRLGFGLGFEVTEHLGPAGRLDTPGAYGWGSAYYPRYFVDPQEEIVALFLTQLIPARDLDLHRRFRTLVYQSIIGGPPRENQK
jgi:CubicO group peptidase (beta-lactamase class C family)